MRKRNIKLNVFLNDGEKKMLEAKSNRARLSQSDLIRNLNIDYKIKTSSIFNKETNVKEIDINNIIRILERNIEYL